MKKLLVLTAMTALFATCTNDDDNNSPQPVADDNQISISAMMAQVTPGTRVTDNGTTTTWVDGDYVGLFCAESNPAAVNLKYEYSSSEGWKPDDKIYWKNHTDLHKFYAYAPYASGNTAATSIAVPVLNVQTGTIAPAQNLLISNNLGTTGITKMTNSGKADLVFTHALALIQLNVVIDATVPAGTKLSLVSLTGQVSDVISTSATGATLNLTSGAITNGSVGSNIVTATPVTSPTLSTTAVPINILVLPGTSSPTLLVKCLLPDTTTPTTIASLGTNVVYAAANKYIYTVTVSRTAINVSNLTITPWTSSGNPTPINPVL